MNPTAQFLFDECIGKPYVANLREMVPGEPTLFHLSDLDLLGQLDEEWIPKIAADGWIVVTSDAGKKGLKGGKLPRLCREHKITHVVLSSTLHQMRAHLKIGALASMWEDLLELRNSKPGTGYKLRYVNKDGGLVLRLVEIKVFSAQP